MKKSILSGLPRIALGGAAAVALALTIGCAGPKPPVLTPKTTHLDLTKGPVVLFSVVTSNQYKPDYSPYPCLAHVLTEKNGSVKERMHELGDMPGPLFPSTAKRVRPIYPMAVQPPPGRSLLKVIGGFTAKPLIMAGFSIPLLLPIDLPAGKVIYAGRIEAVNRERKGDELRAGPVVPLIDQAVAGYAGGTFDVKVFDAAAEDLDLLNKEYPALKDQKIETILWPSWNRLTKEEMSSAKRSEGFNKSFSPAK